MSEPMCENCANLTECTKKYPLTKPGERELLACVMHEPVKPICPLPRIGSKEWGWKRGEEKHVLEWDPSGSVQYRSPHTSIFVCKVITRTKGYKGVGYYVGDRADDVLTLRDAKTIAEALARRDWRRENKAK